MPFTSTRPTKRDGRAVSKDDDEVSMEPTLHLLYGGEVHDRRATYTDQQLLRDQVFH